MSSAVSKRRMAENEVVFREYNEKVQKGFDDLAKIAKEEGHAELAVQDDKPLHFFCECSDENCHKRILLKPSAYNEMHANRKRFVIIRGHETDSIEKVVQKKSTFNLVEKFVPVPASADRLNTTTVNNT